MKNRAMNRKNMNVFLIIILFLLSTHIFSFAQNLEWKLFNNECGKNVTDIFEYEPNKFIVKSELGFFKIHDGISEEIIFPLSSNYIITSINMDSKGILYVATEKDGVFRYIYSKNQWEDIRYNIKNIPYGQLLISPQNRILINELYGTMYEFDENNKLWKKIFDKAPRYVTFINDEGDLFAADYKDFSYLPFGDTSWIFIDILEKLKTFSYIYGMYEFKIYVIENRIYLINQVSGIYYSDDLMKTMFHNNVIRDVFKNFLKLLVTKEKEWIMLSSSEGVLYSNNGAKTFEQNNHGLPSDSVLAGLSTKNDNVMISIKNHGLYISEVPKNQQITDNMDWIERPNFKIKKVFNYNIKALNYSNDGLQIFASAFTYGYGGNHEIQLSILDVKTGKLLKNHRIPSDDLMTFNVSEDKKYIIAYYLTYVFNSFDYKVSVVIYNIDDLSIKYQFKLNRNYPHCNLDLNYAKYFSSIYDDIKNEMIFSYSLTNICKNGSKYHTISEVVQVDFNNDTTLVKTLYNKPIQQMIKINENKLLFWEYDLTEYKQMNDIFYSYLFKLADFDFSNQIILTADSNMNNIQYSPIYNFVYNRPKNHLVLRNRNDTISIYDLNSISLLKKFRLKDIYTNTYNFSIDGRRMLNFHNKGVAFFKYPDMELIDSIPFKYETGYMWTPVMSPDNKSFAVGTYDGVVRLFNGRLLVSVPEGQSPEMYRINSNILLSPNPATDYINIQPSESFEPSEGYKIQIYDILGIEVSSAGGAVNEVDSGGNLRIDISNIPAGVYFIRIGDRVEKFVKM